MSGQTQQVVKKAVKQNIDNVKEFLGNSILKNVLINNSLKNSFRFESQQNTIWTFEELHQHSQAFALGLVELGYKQGDRLGFMIERSFPSEVVAAQMGCLKTGVIMVPIKPQNVKDLQNELKKNELKGLLFSPNSKCSDLTYEQLIKEVVPESTKGGKGSALKSKEFKSLEHLIHTGFYNMEGTFKYRQMMVYGMRESSQWKYLDGLVQKDSQDAMIHNGKTISMKQLWEKSNSILKKYNINEDSNVVISGENRSILGMALGLMHSLKNQSQVIMTGNMNLQEVHRIINWHSNPVWVIEDALLKNVNNSIKNNQVSQVILNSYHPNQQFVDTHIKNFEAFKIDSVVSSLI